MNISRRDSASELRFSILVPPPVPKSRGPSLPDGRQTPGGPPRTTPMRAANRYYRRQGRPGGGSPPSSARAPVAHLIPKHTTGESIAWSEENTIANSPTSLNFEIVSESATLHGDRASIVFEVEPGTDSASKRHRASPPTGLEEYLRGTSSAMRAAPLPGVVTPRACQRSVMPNPAATPTRSTPSHSTPSLQFHVINSSGVYDDDDAESLPSALPPPKPYPVVGLEAAAQHGAKETKLRLYGNVLSDNLVSPRGRRSVRGAPMMYTDGAVEKEGRPYATSMEVVAPAPPVVSAPSPPPSVLHPPAQSLLNEVNAWVDVIHGVEDTNSYRLYLKSTEKALHDTQHEIEALAAENAVVDRDLQAAKASHVASLDGNHARKKKPVAHVGRDEEGEEEELAQEEEWRIEKGGLLAEKALLLQKRKELCHHLRRGTNIKNVAALALSGRGSWSWTDSSTHDTASEDTAPPVTDLETIQLRLKLKEAQVQFMNLVDSHRILQSARRTRTKEFEEEFVSLRHSATSARQEAEGHRGTLEATLQRAEQLRGKCRQKGEESLLVLLEQRMEEAHAALRLRDDRLLLNTDSFRSRMSSIGRCSSTGSTARRVSGASVSPAGAAPKGTATAEQNSPQVNGQK